MWFVALLIAPSAEALTEDRSGVSVDLAIGGSLHLPPTLGTATGFGSVGWWWGPYDRSYAIGRYWSVNLNGRGDLSPSGDLAIAPSVEVRRGVDLVVAGWYFGLGAGPVLVPSPGIALGAGGRAAFGGEFRRSRFWGLTLRVEAGVDAIGDQITGAGALMLGVQFSRPADGEPVE